MKETALDSIVTLEAKEEGFRKVEVTVPDTAERSRKMRRKSYWNSRIGYLWLSLRGQLQSMKKGREI